MSANADANAGNTHDVPDIAGFLRGAWSVSRTISEATTGGATSFDGTATFTSSSPEDHELAYEELGFHVVDDQPLVAARRYRYAITGPTTADVLFENGELFHDLDLSGGRWHCVHHCGDDLYRGEFAVTGSDAWSVSWRIDGPRKATAITSHYARNPQGRTNPPSKANSRL